MEDICGDILLLEVLLQKPMIESGVENGSRDATDPTLSHHDLRRDLPERTVRRPASLVLLSLVPQVSMDRVIAQQCSR